MLCKSSCKLLSFMFEKPKQFVSMSGYVKWVVVCFCTLQEWEK